jgi:hypothetical protein
MDGLVTNLLVNGVEVTSYVEDPNCKCGRALCVDVNAARSTLSGRIRCRA